jgi:hypothetical protein
MLQQAKQVMFMPAIHHIHMQHGSNLGDSQYHLSSVLYNHQVYNLPQPLNISRLKIAFHMLQQAKQVMFMPSHPAQTHALLAEKWEVPRITYAVPNKIIKFSN